MLMTFNITTVLYGLRTICFHQICVNNTSFRLQLPAE